MEHVAPKGYVPEFKEHLRTVPKRAMIRNQWGRNAHASHIKEMLGLPSKLPREAVPAQVIQGVKVWVKAAPALEVYQHYTGQTRVRHRATHRVMCECPHCGEEMSVGRLHQHKCKE